MGGSGNDKGCWPRTGSGGGGEPCGFTIAGPVPVVVDEGAHFMTPAGSLSGWWSSAVVAGTANPYGFVIAGLTRTSQPRAGDPEGEGRAAFPSSGDTLLPAASCPSNLLGDGVSSVQDSLRQVPFRRRRAHPIFLETVLLLGATPDDIFQDFTPIGLFVVADSRAAAPSPPIFLEAASLLETSPGGSTLRSSSCPARWRNIFWGVVFCRAATSIDQPTPDGTTFPQPTFFY